MGTGRAWLLAMSHFKYSLSSGTVPRGFPSGTWSSWWASVCPKGKSPFNLFKLFVYVLLHWQWFPIVPKLPLMLMVFFAPFHAYFYIHSFNYRHLDALILHLYISMCTALLRHLNVSVDKHLHHIFVCTHPLYVRPQVISWGLIVTSGKIWFSTCIFLLLLVKFL